MNPHCPACGKPGIPIVYGKPGPDLIDATDRVLGGCVLGEVNPDWACPEGHRWVDSGRVVPPAEPR